MNDTASARSKAERRLVQQTGPTSVSDSVLPLTILLAAVAIFFAKVLFTRNYIIPWDFRGFHLPLATVVSDAMRGTGSVLWDTSTYCGRPLFADPQAQVFYPPTDAAIFLSTFLGSSRLAYVLEWEMVLHIFAAGAFTYLMLRRIGLSTAAALCGGLVFSLGGFFASQTQHFGAIEGAAWIPLMWAAVWELRRAFVGKWFGALTLASAMAILAGFPAIASTAIASTIVFSVILLIFGETRPRGVLIVLTAVLVAVGLSGVMLAPAIQLTLSSVAKYRSDWFDGSGLPSKILISLIMPPNHDKICDLLYCGIGGLSLALIAVFNRHPRSFALPLLCLTLLSGIWMFGTGTIYGQVVWAITPDLVKGSLYPSYGMVPFCLGVAALAGIGLDRIKRLTTSHKYIIALFVATDLIIVGSNRPMNATDIRKEPGMTREQIDGSAATLAKLLDLTQGEPPTRIDTHDGTASFSTTAPLTQIPTANGYNPLALERLIQVRLSFAKGYRWGAWYEVENLRSPLVDALNVRYILTRKSIDTTVNGVPKYSLRAELPGFLVYENSTVLPRFFLVHEVRLAHTQDEAFAYVRRADFEPSKHAVVEEQLLAEENVGVRSLQSIESVQEDHTGEGTEVLHYGAREITLAVRARTPSFLVTSEVHYPGWHAWIDNAEVPVFMTNGAFRGLFVPAGNHVVHLAFAPRIQYLGAGISVLFAIATLAISRLKKTSA